MTWILTLYSIVKGLSSVTVYGILPRRKIFILAGGVKSRTGLGSGIITRGIITFFFCLVGASECWHQFGRN
jgi:hypothetical protein